MGVGEAGEHPWSWGPAEQVQLAVHVQFVGIQLHLLRGGEGGRKGDREEKKKEVKMQYAAVLVWRPLSRATTERPAR